MEAVAASRALLPPRMMLLLPLLLIVASLAPNASSGECTQHILGSIDPAYVQLAAVAWLTVWLILMLISSAQLTGCATITKLTPKYARRITV
jgi:hypothetical protein